MSKIIAFLLSTIVFTLFSCQPVLKLWMGVKKPEQQNVEYILNSMAKRMPDIDTTYSAELSLVLLLDSIGVLGCSNIMIFDDQGDLVRSLGRDECRGRTEGFLRSYFGNGLQTEHVSSGIRIENILEGLRDIHGRPIDVMQWKDRDEHSIFFIWASFCGRFTSKYYDIVRTEYKILKDAGINVAFIPLNWDIRDWWEE